MRTTHSILLKLRKYKEHPKESDSDCLDRLLNKVGKSLE